MSREAIMVSNTAGDIRVTSERATIFSAAWRAASATNADLVTWSRSAASEISWSVASSVRSSRRRVLVVVMVVPPHITVRDLYGNYERGYVFDRRNSTRAAAPPAVLHKSTATTPPSAAHHTHQVRRVRAQRQRTPARPRVCKQEVRGSIPRVSTQINGQVRGIIL